MPSHGEVGAHEWPVTAGTDRPVAIGTRTVDKWTVKLSTETGPRRGGPGYTAISAPNVWGAAREVPPLRAGVIVPMRPGNGQWDQQGLRAAGALPRKRRGAGGFVCDTNAHGPVERRLAERTESGCAMTALRPPRCGACRAVSFTSASASLAPTVGDGRRRSTTERGHKTEPNFYRRRNNDDRHADC